MINNKKGSSGGTLNVGMTLALFIGVVLLIFLFGGGISTIYNISQFLKQIPAFIWVIFGVILLFKWISK